MHECDLHVTGRATAWSVIRIHTYIHTYIPKLDLNSAYWQVPMAPEDREKTAFCTETDHWEFLVMPYGLKNAPSCFTRLIADALRGLLGNGVTAYLDDFIIGGKTFQEHLTLLEVVLERLRQAGQTVKSKKVVACRRKAPFSGAHSGYWGGA